MIKNLSLSLLGGLLVAGSAMAATPTKMVTNQRADLLEKQNFSGEISLNGYNFIIDSEKSKALRNPAKALPVTKVITSAKGESKTYAKSAEGYYLLYNMYLDSYANDAIASEIVWGDNNEVFFPNIMSNAITDTYVKGVYNDGIITVPMNQTVYYYDQVGYGFNLCMLKTVLFWSTDDYGQPAVGLDFVYDPSIESIDYAVAEDGTVKAIFPMAPPVPDSEYDPALKPYIYGLPDYVLGYVYTDDEAWVGYIDWTQIYRPFEPVAYTMPEDVEAVPFSYVSSDGLGVVCLVAETEDAIYVKGLCPMIPDAVTKIELLQGDYTKIGCIPQNQYQATIDIYYVVTKVMMTGFDPDNDLAYALAPDTIGYFLMLGYDEEGNLNSITTEFDSMNMSLVYNAALGDIFYVDIIDNLNLKRVESLEGTPVEPSNVYYTDEYQFYYGFNDIIFTLNNVSTEGNALDIDYMGYSIYIDGEPMTFMEQDGIDFFDEETVMYYGVMQPTTILPLAFSNDWDIYVYDINNVDIGLYLEGFTTIGVQAVYFYSDEFTYSDIVTINVETGERVETLPQEAGISSTVAEAISESFIDINGRAVSNPQKGIYLKKTVYSDGSVKTRKIVVR